MTIETIDGKSVTRMPCCGVAAVAHVAGLSIADTFEIFKTKLKKKSNWKGRTYDCERVVIMNALKVQHREYKGAGHRVTLAKFIDQHTKPDTTYMIRTTSHVQVVRNGVITDQRGNSSVSDYWGSRKIVKSVLIIKNPKSEDVL